MNFHYPGLTLYLGMLHATRRANSASQWFAYSKVFDKVCSLEGLKGRKEIKQVNFKGENCELSAQLVLKSWMDLSLKTYDNNIKTARSVEAAIHQCAGITKEMLKSCQALVDHVKSRISSALELEANSASSKLTP